MPYTKLTSFQFERGKGFTEESVLTFRVLALNVIDELMRHEAPGTTIANFSLTPDEVRLILEHRRAAYGQPGDTDADLVLAENPPTDLTAPTSLLPSPTGELTESTRDATVAAGADTSGTEAEPADDEFAAAARWLALATRAARTSV